MTRNLRKLSGQPYDAVVIGGGVYGACVAWDAALRGLSVALVDKGDFGHATSSKSLRLIHGGFRYLKDLDIARMRMAIRERTTWMRIAPHIVHPLPVLLPTYGHWKRGKELLGLGLWMNDLIGFDRNRLGDPGKYIPRGRLISRNDCLRFLPEIPAKGLTGGAIWYDCQMRNSERLIVSILASATDAGADVANYVEVTGFIKTGAQIRGVQARDVLGRDQIEIQAKVVINTSGPWVEKVRCLRNGHPEQCRAVLVKAMNVLTRPLTRGCAVGLSMSRRMKDVDRHRSDASRLLFITPWRNRSMIGTSQAPYVGDPDEFSVTDEEICEFMDQINTAIPEVRLNRKDICLVHAGLVPMNGEGRSLTADFATRYQIYDHSAEGAPEFISVVGVKFTEARRVAEEVVNLLFHKLGKTAPMALTREKPIRGGEIECFEELLTRERANHPKDLGPEITDHLVYTYGAEYPRLLEYCNEDPSACEPIGSNSTVLRAEVIHGIRKEMAQKLTDVVFRRTELGTAGHPGNEDLAICAGIMANEFGWSPSRVRDEINEVEEAFALGQSRA